MGIFLHLIYFWYMTVRGRESKKKKQTEDSIHSYQDSGEEKREKSWPFLSNLNCISLPKASVSARCWRSFAWKKQILLRHIINTNFTKGLMHFRSHYLVSRQIGTGGWQGWGLFPCKPHWFCGSTLVELNFDFTLSLCRGRWKNKTSQRQKTIHALFCLYSFRLFLNCKEKSFIISQLTLISLRKMSKVYISSFILREGEIITPLSSLSSPEF